MDAKELRIGNWVHHKESWSYRQSTKGEEIFSFDFKWDDSDWFALGECELFLEDIEPIPITEEWLLNFGWRYYNGKTDGDLTMDFGYKMDVDFIKNRIQIKSHFEEEYVYRDGHIKFVHQLQNLYFALTGNELELKNNES